MLHTNANCRVMSDQWLRTMMRNFVPGTDVVLGFSHYRYRKDTSAGRYFRVFDSVVTSLQWVGSAIKGKPYRGISDNLAYRRQLFFDHAGFSESLELRYGDDDVFVSAIATGDNTRLELAPESQMGCPRGSRGARLYQHFHHFGSHIFAHTLMGDDDIAV